MKSTKIIIVLSLFIILILGCSSSKNNDYILFVSFKDPGTTGIYYALSNNAVHFEALNRSNPIITCSDSIKKMRDPFIVRDPQRGFHMVWTMGKRMIGYAWSPDLIDWSMQKIIPIDAQNDSVANTWAPEIIFDEINQDWHIIYSSTILGNFPETIGQVNNNKNHRIYSVKTKDFTTFTKPELFFDPGYPIIDATILKEQDEYLMVFKDERDNPLKKLLKTASSSSLTGSWKNISDPLTPSWSEGPTLIKHKNKYLIYYDFYKEPKHMGLMMSNDFKSWEDISDKTIFPSGYKHGSFIHITMNEAQRLKKHY